MISSSKESGKSLMFIAVLLLLCLDVDEVEIMLVSHFLEKYLNFDEFSNGLAIADRLSKLTYRKI